MRNFALDAERCLRWGVVIFRKNSCWLKSVDGEMMREILWTLSETLPRRKIDVLDFMRMSLYAFMKKEPLRSPLNLNRPVAQKYFEMAGEEAGHK
ncbi:MAG: hypothetical protein LBT40_04715 [Deltaproteobacteria bacterium]|jgi:hypothetical protein|nr:hypothetical protein [Deltaproteobacteria bacterium]